MRQEEQRISRGSASESVTRVKRRRKLLPNDQAAKIARERFGELAKSGTLKSIKDLAADYNRAPAVISRSITRALKERLVEVKITEKRPLIPERDDGPGGLEEGLLKNLKKYRRLNKAIVIKSNDTEDSDIVHERLGMAMAEFIATGAVFQSGCRIGVGSGRGVENLLTCLRHFPGLRAQNVSLFSLTGSVYSRPNQTTTGLWFDTDSHVIDFAKFFDEKPRQYLICHPLAYEVSDVKKARSRTWLGDPSIPALTHLLVGVGTVAKHHRFYIEAHASLSDQEPFLKPIHNLLANLVSLCDTATGGLADIAPLFSPAAEMSNYFFYVPPPPDQRLSLNDEKNIKACIKKINARLLSGMQKGQPDNSQLLVVAGTREKSHVLRALLEDEAYKVTYLCTDESAAAAIVGGEA